MKNPFHGWGMDIFWNHTLLHKLDVHTGMNLLITGFTCVNKVRDDV